MAINATDKEGGIFNEINITPLTDIFLVLLIIMMVLAPMFQAVDKNISMPKIKSGDSVAEDEVKVSITRNAEFFVNGTATAPEQLETALAKYINKSKEKAVVVKADNQTKSKEIMKVMSAAEQAGYEKLTVAGEPLSQQQQDNLHKKATNNNSDME